MEMETRMNEINLLTQKGHQSWKIYENNVMNIESRISNDAATLHYLVDKMAQKRQDELNNMSKIEQHGGRLDKEKSKISTCLAQHDKCLSSMTTTGIAELLDESKILRSKLLNPIEVVPPSYQSSSNTSIEGIGEIIKQSKVLPISHNSKLKEGKAEVIPAFSYKLEGTPSICYAGNCSVLIGTDKSKDIHTVNSRGTIVHKRKRVLKDKCYSLAVAYSGDILVSPILSTGIKILDGQNKLKTLFKTSSYKTRFVTITEKQEILVCLIKWGRREGRVILCNSQGGNERRIGSDDLYLEPMQAVQLQDGGFCISDYDKQQPVVLNSDGNVRHIIQNPLGRGQFWSRGICTDKAGNILATVHCNDCVYVIGEDMSVREFMGRTEGIIEPMCLCVEDDTNVWLAQFNGEIKVIKYLEDKYIL